MKLHAGWYLAAFVADGENAISPVHIGDRSLMLVHDNGTARAFDAVCPHRGANLAYGGRLERNCVICPFHGKAITLGEVSEPRLGVREYPCLTLGPLVFVRVDDEANGDRGFVQTMQQYAQDRTFFAGSEAPLAVAPEYIVENAFDVAHFTAVHRVPRVQMDLAETEMGELVIDGHMEYVAGRWVRGSEGQRIRNRFHARAYSPTVVVSEVGEPPDFHLVITGAVPTPTGCVIRIGYAVSPEEPGGAVSDARISALIQGGERALAEDTVVWEHLDTCVPARYDKRDGPVLEFRRFCDQFPMAAP